MGGDGIGCCAFALVFAFLDVGCLAERAEEFIELSQGYVSRVVGDI